MVQDFLVVLDALTQDNFDSILKAPSCLSSNSAW